MRSGYITFFLLFICSTIVRAQATLPNNVLTTLRPSHPRLLVRSLKDFDDLKAAIPKDEFLRHCNRVVMHNADSLLKEDAVKYVLNNQLGGQLLEVSRTLYRRIYILAMAYRLTGDKKYADKAWENLHAASQFPDWNPWHFLDVSEMMHGFAIGYDWLYDVWTPEQRKIIKQAIIDKGLSRAYMVYHEMLSHQLVEWPKSNSNWNQVCSGGIGLAALAVADEEPILCNYLIRQAIEHIPATMKKLQPDGATEEGPGYWKFGTQYNVALIASLETALGSDFGLSQIPGFSKTGKYFLAMGSNKGRPFDYADCWTDHIQAPELFWFAKKYNQPLLASYQIKNAENNVLEMLWYDPAIKGGDELPRDNYFRAAEVATLRSNWSDPNAWFVGFKAGSNTANHGHLDIGDFVIERNGKRWAMDLQHDTYDLPGYFDVLTGQRWTYYRLKAEGHNTLVIDPDLQPDQNPKAKCTISKFKSTPSGSFGVMNITDAYAGKLTSLKRGVALQGKNGVVVQDELVTNNPLKDVYWFTQTPASVLLSADKKTAILTIGSDHLKVQIASGPKDALFEVLSATPLPTTPHPPAQNENKGISRLTIHLKNVTSTTLTVTFKDMDDNSTTAITPLKNW